MPTSKTWLFPWQKGLAGYCHVGLVLKFNFSNEEDTGLELIAIGSAPDGGFNSNAIDAIFTTVERSVANVDAMKY